jgi:hypothetical protein
MYLQGSVLRKNIGKGKWHIFNTFLTKKTVYNKDVQNKHFFKLSKLLEE